MAKGMLSVEAKTSERLTNNKARKVLQTLNEEPPNKEEIIGKMVKPTDKTLPSKAKSKTVENLNPIEKENALTVRRSKRKNAASSIVNYVDSPEVSKITKTTAKGTSKTKKTTKSKKGNSTAVKKNEQSKLNQSKLQFSPVESSSTLNENLHVIEAGNSEKRLSVTSITDITSTTEVTEDSGFDPCNGISDQSPTASTAVVNYPDAKSSATPFDETFILTANIPPLSYWKDLAEQRRIALEKTLHENELLQDQLTVLEAETSQLKKLLKEAENVVEVLRDIVE